MENEHVHKIKVLLADDHAVFREGLKLILSETQDIVATGDVDNGYAVLEAVRKTVYDVVILDVSMPGKSGLETLKQLKVEYPKLPVLVLSMYPEDRIAVRFLQAGASGYVTKASASDQLVKAIKTVHHGQKFISAELAQKLAHNFLYSERIPHEMLSDREYQVLCMIGFGKTVSGIAEELILSVKTVSTHRTHILEKLNLKNSAQLIRYALENKLIE